MEEKEDWLKFDEDRGKKSRRIRNMQAISLHNGCHSSCVVLFKIRLDCERKNSISLVSGHDYGERLVSQIEIRVSAL